MLQSKFTPPMQVVSSESPEPSICGGAILETQGNGQLESFLKYLIERGFVDNEHDSSETIHRFLEIFEQFEGSNNDDSDESDEENEANDDCEGGISKQKSDPFETRAIFTMADFLKSLGPNEYYDIAQKIFNKWDKKEGKKEQNAEEQQPN